MNGAVPTLSLVTTEQTSEVEPDDSAAPSGTGLGYALLFAPFGLAMLASPMPLLSYLVAWLGSFVILWLTLGGHVRPLPGGSAFDQVMRPIVLTQILFAAYNFVSSAFYVADLYGFYYFERLSTAPLVPGAIEVAAEAQRYYVLAHAAIASGILFAMDYRRSAEWVVRPLEDPARVALWISVIGLGVGTVLGVQNQFGIRIEKLGLVASVIALGLAISTRRSGTLLLALALFAVNMGSAFLSGWKEEVLVMVLLAAVFLYPYARKTVTLGAPIALVLLLAVLPTYVDIIRGLSWRGGVDAEEAAATAVAEIQSGEADLGDRNWQFLTGRISEIGLFVQYIDSFERQDGGGGQDYYGIQIVRQSAMSLIPRVFWSDKPITEAMVMERVYEAGITTRDSRVSAKPQYVVDGYLSAGFLGVLLAGLAFGLLASLASRACERWFGGYFWGSGLVYTAMFSMLWKGNTFEFFFNTIFWSFVLLVPLFWIGRRTGLLVRADEVVVDAEPAVTSGRTRGRTRVHGYSRSQHWAGA